jgi:superfamily II DNA/RNA helicase
LSSSFSDLGVPAGVVASLAARGITDAFAIQSLAIPPALAGRDVCGKAPTGSGKTLAFGIPLAMRVSQSRAKRPSGLVLAPTRELAAQIQAELRPLLAARKRSVASFYGGVSFGPQLKALHRGVDVAVACPGRLADLVRRGDLFLDQVEMVVIDEADRMADMGFLPEVRRILDGVRPDRQTLLFSATLDGDVDVLVRRYQREPQRCEAPPDVSEGVRTTHEFVSARREDRVGMTAALVAKHGSTVVFCRTKHGADRVAAQLQRAGVYAVPIHGGRSQAQRDRALRSFMGGDAKALVATDVAARGIHVDNVGCVVHFDLAGDHKDYLHRSGRTGRAGAAGVVVSLVTETDAAKARQLQRALGLSVHHPADRANHAPSRPAPSGSRRAGSRRRQPAAGGSSRGAAGAPRARTANSNRGRPRAR